MLAGGRCGAVFLLALRICHSEPAEESAFRRLTDLSIPLRCTRDDKVVRCHPVLRHGIQGFPY